MQPRGTQPSETHRLTHCETRDMGLVNRVVYLFTPELSLVFIVSTYEGMTRLS